MLHALQMANLTQQQLALRELIFQKPSRPHGLSDEEADEYQRMMGLCTEAMQKSWKAWGEQPPPQQPPQEQPPQGQLAPPPQEQPPQQREQRQTLHVPKPRWMRWQAHGRLGKQMKASREKPSPAVRASRERVLRILSAFHCS